MHLIHNQTACFNPLNPPLKTSWSTSYSSGTTQEDRHFVGPGFIYPIEGDGLVYQDATGPSLTYTNTRDSTWNQYTIEGWVYMLPTSLTYNPMQIRIGNTTDNFLLFFQANAAPGQVSISGAYYPAGGGSQPISASGGFYPMEQWIYYSFVKVSDTERFLMINGSLAGTVVTTNFSETNTNKRTVNFSSGATPSPPLLWDMTRISNVARYASTDTFTPPTSAFTNDVHTWLLATFDYGDIRPAPSPT